MRCDAHGWNIAQDRYLNMCQCALQGTRTGWYVTSLTYPTFVVCIRVWAYSFQSGHTAPMSLRTSFPFSKTMAGVREALETPAQLQYTSSGSANVGPSIACK